MSTKNTGEGDVYCTSCGKSIVREAEMCPECGASQPIEETVVGQNAGGQSSGAMNEMMEYDLQKVASKSKVAAALLGFLISPLGYAYVGKWGLAVVNFLTFNYLFLGFVIVPLHVWYMISKAEEKLDRAGVSYE